MIYYDKMSGIPVSRLPEGFQLTVEDMQSYDWNADIRALNCYNCRKIWEPLHLKAAEKKSQGDERGFRVYSMLEGVASFLEGGTVKGKFFGPYWRNIQGPGSQALSPEDLTIQDQDTLKGILSSIENPEMKARVGHVLWECRKDFQGAKEAITSYLELTERCADDEWHSFERFARAARLAKAIRGEPLNQVLEKLEQYLERLGRVVCSHSEGHLVQLCLELGFGPYERYIDRIEKRAYEFEASGQWDLGKEHWMLAFRIAEKIPGSMSGMKARMRAAECLLKKAESAETLKLGGGYQATCMGHAYSAFQAAKAAPEVIEQIGVRFRQLQKDSMKEFQTFSFDPSKRIPGFREQEEKQCQESAAAVCGLSLEEAVWTLTRMEGPTDVVELEKNVIEMSKRNPFQAFMGLQALSSTGLVLDNVPSPASDPAAQDEALTAEMCKLARDLNWPLAVMHHLEPARIQIIREHAPKVNDLTFLVAASPFIPPGHEGIYLQGLHAGLVGNWTVAMHLLVPQIEASLRFLFAQAGKLTVKMETATIQREHDINKLLYEPLSQEIFGPDILFDLRAILVDKFGCNLRNELAHGLVTEGYFHQPAARYFWWLVLHILWRFKVVAEEAACRESGEQGETTDP
ncbi:MAG TPA: hypothetical protein DCP71_09935 [Verrucomicrobiales bacterium]|nr:hypothetical protein [Verrucomicrobiales bacterium]